MRPRLLILRALKLGDLLTSVPALRGLARAFPSHERIFAGPAGLEPLVRMIHAERDPVVDRVVGLNELEPLPQELEGCEVAVNLHGRGPQSHRLLQAARPKQVLWFRNAEIPASAGAPAWRPDEHEIVRWCRMLAGYGVTADPADIYLHRPAGARRTSNLTLIHPGASSPARQWPVERFAAVARAERNRGHDVMITGTRRESNLARRLAQAAGLPARAVLAGKTDLLDLARTVADAGRIVCGDTGVAHLAFALNTPSVVLFGPTSPAHWGPRAGDGLHRALWAGRRGDPHGTEADPGLLEIQADDVIAALGKLP